MLPHIASAARPADFNPAINGMRGICVLLVFAYHVFNSRLLPDLSGNALFAALSFFASSWRYGVELFFMISGYVIVASLRRHGSAAAFLRDRCLRIFPVWAPVCVLVFVVGATVGWKIFGELSAAHLGLVLGANLLLLPPLLPIPVLHPASWSLSYEWVFYLLAATAFALSKRPGIAIRRISLWCIWGGAVLVVLWYLPRAIFFLPGVVLAGNRIPLSSKLLHWPWLSLLIMLLAWRAIDLDQAHPGAYAMPAAFAGENLLFLVVALLAGLHLFACVCAGAASVRWLCRSDVQLLGTLSYSFYLWHPIVMFAVKQPVAALLKPGIGAIGATAVFALLSFVISLLCSWLSYRLFERGVAAALRRRVERRRPASIPAAAQSIAPGLRVEGS